LRNPQAAGDFLVVGATCTVIQIADTQLNDYTKFVADPASGLETWGASNIRFAQPGANTVTVTFAQPGCSYQNIKVVEYSGVDPVAPVDGTISAHGEGGAPAVTLLSGGNELLFAHTQDTACAFDAGAGWTKVLYDEWCTLAEERIVTEAGTYPVTYVPGNNEWWAIQGIALRCQ
jgi:hypothetical protein